MPKKYNFNWRKKCFYRFCSVFSTQFQLNSVNLSYNNKTNYHCAYSQKDYSVLKKYIKDHRIHLSCEYMLLRWSAITIKN
jgi:hypothetical protein